MVPVAPSAAIALPPVAGVNCVGLTVMAGLVLAVLLPSSASVAVTVKLPLVPKARVKLPVPATKAALAGKAALRSLEVRATISLTLLTTFQLASTALTVESKSTVANWPLGVPFLPLAVPGAAVSPGTSNWSLVNAPGLTLMLPLVLEVNPVALAVIVRVPAVLNVRLDRVSVPETRVIFPLVPPLSSAMLALLSLAVIVTLAVELAGFQLASTALTMTLLSIAVPAA